MTLLMILAIFLLILVIALTANNRIVKNIAKMLLIAQVSFFLSLWIQADLCDTKILGYSYCGELTGIIRMFLVSCLISVVSFVAIGINLFRKGK